MTSHLVEEELEYEESKRHERLWVLSCCLLVLFLGLVAIWQIRQIARFQNQIEKLVTICEAMNETDQYLLKRIENLEHAPNGGKE